MVKPSAPRRPRATFASIIAFIVLIVLVGAPAAAAASPVPPNASGMLPEASQRPLDVRKLWTRQIPGLMTDLAVSRDGSATIVATIPNPDLSDGPREPGHGLTRFDRAGRRSWHIELEGAVKSLALTADGKLALVSTYDNKISGIDARGRTLWSVDGTCRPIPIGKRFVCYHDDDAEPEVAFDVFTDGGRKVLSYPVTGDVMALKVSEDGSNTALGLTDGQVILLGPDFKPRCKVKVDGEVIDVAVSSGEHPRVAALFRTEPRINKAKAAPWQSIAVFDETGQRLAVAVPDARGEQIESLPGGEGIAFYGNEAEGQFVAFYDLPQSSRQVIQLAPKWQHRDLHVAEFSSSLTVTHDQVIVGYEQITSSDRHSHLVAYDLNGGLRWDIPLETKDGAYLYTQGFALHPLRMSVGTDDGYVHSFALKPGQ